ncbi:WAS/WASL-interacting protein family member 3-like [Antechinus flavipes]|uniref:WAS/WASL-interacting protein family member 3-like n=1 Tax=Antechinus flavipes TaxID=38775 RepID=UPI0022364CE5|nr:WAS/WASL-interacting protein family member 3-like [Antechinus flavipes]
MGLEMGQKHTIVKHSTTWRGRAPEQDEVQSHNGPPQSPELNDTGSGNRRLGHLRETQRHALLGAGRGRGVGVETVHPWSPSALSLRSNLEKAPLTHQHPLTHARARTNKTAVPGKSLSRTHVRAPRQKRRPWPRPGTPGEKAPRPGWGRGSLETTEQRLHPRGHRAEPSSSGGGWRRGHDTPSGGGPPLLGRGSGARLRAPLPAHLGNHRPNKPTRPPQTSARRVRAGRGAAPETRERLCEAARRPSRRPQSTHPPSAFPLILLSAAPANWQLRGTRGSRAELAEPPPPPPPLPPPPAVLCYTCKTTAFPASPTKKEGAARGERGPSVLHKRVPEPCSGGEDWGAAAATAPAAATSYFPIQISGRPGSGTPPPTSLPRSSRGNQELESQRTERSSGSRRQRAKDWGLEAGGAGRVEPEEKGTRAGRGGQRLLAS